MDEEYVVITKFKHDERGYYVYRFTSKDEAMLEASSSVDLREETIVARVIARSVTTSIMKEVV